MAKLKIDYKTVYSMLKSVVERYEKSGKITETFIASIMKDEVLLSKNLGLNELTLSNIDYSKIGKQQARILAGELLDIEDDLPYNVRRVASVWIKEYTGIEVDGDE
ncbi:MAG: hypothetical protein ACRCX8_14165 [Sarcina sp.]